MRETALAALQAVMAEPPRVSPRRVRIPEPNTEDRNGYRSCPQENLDRKIAARWPRRRPRQVERRMISDYCDFTMAFGFRATGQLPTRGASMTANLTRLRARVPSSARCALITGPRTAISAEGRSSHLATCASGCSALARGQPASSTRQLTFARTRMKADALVAEEAICGDIGAWKSSRPSLLYRGYQKPWPSIARFTKLPRRTR